MKTVIDTVGGERRQYPHRGQKLAILTLRQDLTVCFIIMIIIIIIFHTPYIIIIIIITYHSYSVLSCKLWGHAGASLLWGPTPMLSNIINIHNPDLRLG